MRRVEVVASHCTSAVVGAGTAALAPSSCDAGVLSSYVYVSAIGECAVAPYELDAATGNLKPLDTCVPVAMPWSMAVSPDNRFLYVTGQSKHEIASFAMDPQTGLLHGMGTMPINTELGLMLPTYLNVDPTSRYLFTCDYFNDKVGMYAIGDDGALLPDSQTVFAVGGGNTGPRTNRNHPHSCFVDPSGKFLIVCFVGYTQTLGSTGPQSETNPTGEYSSIRFYPFDAAASTLGEVEVARIKPQGGTGPRHLAFHPTRPWMYVNNERGPRGSSVSLFHMHAGEAKLTEGGTWSTVPPDFPSKTINATADIHITPNGRFLYVSNRSKASNLAGFEISQVDGSLRPLGQFKTVPVPTTFAIDPSGQFLLSGSVAKSVIAVHSIHPHTGHLSEPNVVKCEWFGDAAEKLQGVATQNNEGGTGTAWIHIVPKMLL